MPQDGNWLFWVIIIVSMVVFLFLPQWMARRRQQKKESELRVGDSIVTIGGFMGEITYLDFEANLARIRLTEGVEVSILPGAISGKRQATPVPLEEEDYEEPEVPEEPDDSR